MKKRHIYIAIAAMMSTASCSDDYFNKDVDVEYSEYIGYSINVTGSDQFQARSAGAMASHEARQLTIDATGLSIGGRPLYLHTEVVDSIPQAVTRAKNGESTVSRGTVTYTGGLTDIGLSAVVFDGEKDVWPAGDGSLSAQMYMHNDKLTAPWQTNRYWPRENDWIRFYAYAPYGVLDDETVDNTVGLPVISTAEPSFSYTIANNIPDQVDLLVGSEQYQGEWCQTAKLDLCHALSAVNIRIDGDVAGFTLNTLTISGLQNRGTYTYNYNESTVGDGVNTTQTHDAGSWSNQGTTDGGGTYTVYPTAEKKDPIQFTGTGSSELKDEDGNTVTYTDMTAGNMVLLMMPQVLTDAATITITGHDEVLNKDVTLSASIVGTKEWEKGKMYTYTLSFTSTRIDYYLEVTPENAANDGEYYISPYHGETDIKFHVRSYKITTRSGASGEIDTVGWAIDKSSLPFWIDQITSNGIDGGELPKEVTDIKYNGTYSVLPNLVYSDTHDALKKTGIKGSENAPWDLSTNAVIQGNGTPLNTANCYMVLSPGYYTFPLVYGNAITNGIDNPKSYQGDLYGNGTEHMGDVNTSYERRYDMEGVIIKGGTSSLTANVDIKTRTYFQDAGGAPIKQPWIVNSNGRGGTYSPKKAEIVWQDEPCLVTEVDLSENEDYITFRVREELITEGNAIIAVKDADNDILWSWHIWVTDQIDNCSGYKAVNFSEPKAMTNRLVSDGYNASVTDPNEWKARIENTFYLMHSHIGACDAATKKYEKATKTVNFKIFDNGVEVVEGDGVTITYKGALNVGVEYKTLTMLDNATYYQFGRKDPMMPGWQEGSETINKPCYQHNRSVLAFATGEANEGSYDLGIRRPDLFFRGSRDTEMNNGATSYEGSSTLLLESWVTDYHAQYINLWNGTFNKLPVYSQVDISGDAEKYYKANEEAILQGVTKTIYDPCPPGYEMPRYDAFTGVSFNGMNLHPFAEPNSNNEYVLSEDINIATVWPNISSLASSTVEGLSFYTSPMLAKGNRSGDEFYIHALGHRNNKGIIAQYNVFGAAATATPMCVQWTDAGTTEQYYKFQACRLCFMAHTKSVRSISTSSFDLAFSIIPARTGKNPSTTTILGNPNWSGDHSDIEVGF